MKKSSGKPSIKGKPMGIIDHVVDLYKNTTKWRFIKHTSIFIIAIYGARTFSDIDLMAPPPPMQ